MANGKLLRQLIRSGAEGNMDAFRGVAKKVIAEERQKQHDLLASDLETIPEDRERGIPLLTVREPVRGLEDIVLSPEKPVPGQRRSSRAQP